MGKLLNFLDKYLLKIGVSFLIAFVALYPKLPSINIPHTWVYIRLEDFFIAFVVILWLIELFRKKIKPPVELGIPIAVYWVLGISSLIFSLIIIAPQLSNFHANVAVLSYLRRIEYMILFFVAFSTIKSIKDVKDYITVLFFTLVGVIIYGFGQRLYIVFWQLVAPLHLTKYFFCFPSFQTGNEEFAKGIPLCLSANGRVTSTFAGQYDLGAYLVFLIPLIITLIFYFRRRIWKIGFSFLFVCSAILLNLTASRVSFIAYILAGIATLVFIKKKVFIPVFLAVSIVILVLFSQSTAKRFMQTFGFASVVIDNQGHIVGEELSPELRAKLTGDNVVGNVVDENLPRGTSYLGLPEFKKEKTNLALVRSGLKTDDAKRLKLENGGVELSTVSGDFLVKKVLVYDISLTTRIQAEWPKAIESFSQNYLLGSGFATITLATDNDYLRLLGETGLLGFISFFMIFMVFGITAVDILPEVKSPFARAFLLGIGGGVFGLFINATLIDVFESSKIAETLWIILGIAMGTAYLYKKKVVDYRSYFVRILKSNYFLFPFLAICYFVVFISVIHNFFVADDFTWLRWAAQSTISDLPKYFTQAGGFFYRPIDKSIFFGIYSLFGFKPEMYHLFILFVHFLSGVLVYLISKRFLAKKSLAVLSAMIFVLLPSQFENLFWISTISSTLSTFFIFLGLFTFIKFRERNNFLFLGLSLAAGALALLSYEMAVVYFLLIGVLDLYLFRTKINLKTVILYIPFVLLDVFYIAIRNSAHSFVSGGDYSYNLAHLLPNAIGNIVGYIGLFVFGEFSLPVYNQARADLKSEGLFVLAFIFVALIALMFVLFLNKKRLIKIYKSANFKLIAFSFIFAFIALLPFIGLGNISPRYGYLASFGFAVALSFVIGLVLSRFKWRFGYLSAVGIILAICLLSLWKLNSEWAASSKITNRTLSYLKLYHETVPVNSTFYFTNVPIRYNNAWVFPVGLTDGVWFLYRDQSPQIVQVATLDEAKKQKEANLGNSYIFYFKDYKMEEVK